MRDDGMNPRLLLVEDDPVSQAYLAEAARDLPAEVDCAGTLSEALTLAAQYRYDAWLIDANLPDGSGASLLARLKQLYPEPHPHALAHTASTSPDDLAALRHAGFDDAIIKPLPIAAWQAVIRRGLNLGPAPVWDDAAALRALNGNAEAIASLRQLFLSELPKQHMGIQRTLAAGDAETARAELHRMKASCGFVGAARLRQAVDDLYDAPMDTKAHAQFNAAVSETLSGS